jgi:Zinc-binding loop region of homing endonuclease
LWPVPKFNENVKTRFERRVSMNLPGSHASPTGCWIWTGGSWVGEYGRMNVRGKQFLAHRLSLMLEGLHVPKRAVVMHLCHVPSCVAPHHLRVGSQAENMADRIRRRAGAGEVI